jgi:hypothetical protein
LISFAACPRQYKSDLEAIFPSVQIKDLLIIPTCQNSEVDLVRTGEIIEQEKDRLLETVSTLIMLMTPKADLPGNMKKA